MNTRTTFGERRSSKGRKKSTLSEDERQECTEAFNLFDSDNSGTIDVREMRAAMRALGFDLKKEEIRDIMDDLDKRPTDELSLDEFLRIATPRVAARDPKEEVAKIFQLFDEDDTGYITFRNLKHVCSELGEDISDEEIQEMIDEADRSGQGRVTFDDFYKIMKKRSANPIDQLSSDDEDVDEVGPMAR
ncbi:MAG: hypothetical protein MHM6MM_005898 [Cercozoa sp. M6MM]